MTTLYENILTQATIAEGEIETLAESIYIADSGYTGFEVQFDAMYATISSVKSWAMDKIEEANKEEVMTNFMTELKVVFDKYAAVMEIGSVESGYGQSYGGSEGVGVKFTATLDGVTSTKTINKSTILSTDLT